MGARKGDNELGPLTIPSDYEDSWHVEEGFIRLLRGEIAAGDLTFYDGVKNIEFLEASHRSLVEGRWVELPLPGSRRDAALRFTTHGFGAPSAPMLPCSYSTFKTTFPNTCLS